MTLPYTLWRDRQLTLVMGTAVCHGGAAYWIWPRRFLGSRRDWPDAWQVHPVPNGDYTIFLCEDFSAGMFGHPSEQSLCVFGSSLSRRQSS